MDTGNVSAIISAAAGISGVILGNSFVALKEWFLHRRNSKQDTTYLGIIVVSHLDRFATGCFYVSSDDGLSCGKPAGEDGQHSVTVLPPHFHPLELDVNWKLLPPDLMYSILRLPDQQDQLHACLSGVQEFDPDPPEHTHYFWMRQRGYAVLGLQASVLAKKLRKYAGLPSEESNYSAWDRDKQLQETIDHFGEKLGD